MTTARDIMTTPVVTATPDTTTRKIAQMLLDHAISAVPVVDSFGAPIGVVSEGDLIGRRETDRETRRDWWLSLLAEGEPLASNFLEILRQQSKTARDVMSFPVVTVEESDVIAKIIDLLDIYHIKRIPVVRDGKVVGIVSRADVLRALRRNALSLELEPKTHAVNTLHRTLAQIDSELLAKGRRPDATRPIFPTSPKGEQQVLSAKEFRALVTDFEQKTEEERVMAKRIAAKKRADAAKELAGLHIDDSHWQGLLRQARTAAEHGEKEALLLRFPHEACSDGGRAINAPEPDWPETLRGEPAEIFLRWKQELRPCGFHLTARIIDFPEGLPGDVGLFLSWA